MLINIYLKDNSESMKSFFAEATPDVGEEFFTRTSENSVMYQIEKYRVIERHIILSRKTRNPIGEDTTTIELICEKINS